MLDTTPRVTKIQVTALRGVTCTIFLMSAVIRPACSARPTPTITTKMMPTGPKLEKFRTMDVSMKRMPSAVHHRSCAFDLMSLRVDDLIAYCRSQQIQQMRK